MAFADQVKAVYRGVVKDPTNLTLDSVCFTAAANVLYPHSLASRTTMSLCCLRLFENSRGKDPAVSVIEAAGVGSVEAIEFIVAEFGEKELLVTHKNDRRNIVHQAAKEGRTEVYSFLRENHPKQLQTLLGGPNNELPVTSDGKNCLHYAAHNAPYKPEMVRMILEDKKDIKASVVRFNDEGKSPLMFALQACSFEAVGLLADAAGSEHLRLCLRNIDLKKFIRKKDALKIFKFLIERLEAKTWEELFGVSTSYLYFEYDVLNRDGERFLPLLSLPIKHAPLRVLVHYYKMDGGDNLHEVLDALSVSGEELCAQLSPVDKEQLAVSFILCRYPKGAAWVIDNYDLAPPVFARVVREVFTGLFGYKPGDEWANKLSRLDSEQRKEYLHALVSADAGCVLNQCDQMVSFTEEQVNAILNSKFGRGDAAELFAWFEKFGPRFGWKPTDVSPYFGLAWWEYFVAYGPPDLVERLASQELDDGSPATESWRRLKEHLLPIGEDFRFEAFWKIKSVREDTGPLMRLENGKTLLQAVAERFITNCEERYLYLYEALVARSLPALTEHDFYEPGGLGSSLCCYVKYGGHAGQRARHLMNILIRALELDTETLENWAVKHELHLFSFPS